MSEEKARYKTKRATSALLIAESPLQVLPSLVVALGGGRYLLDAIFVQQIHYWLQNPKMGKVVDGVKYVAFTYDELQAQMSWADVDTLRAVVSRLTQKGVLLVGQHASNKMDKTNHYGLDYKAIEELIGVSDIPVKQGDDVPVEGGDGQPAKGGDGRTSSTGTSTLNQRINQRITTKNGDSRNAFSEYQNNIALLTPISSEQLGALVDEYTDAWVCDAIAEAVGRNARNLKYIEAILRNWKANGRGARKSERVSVAVDNGEGFYG